MPGTHYNNNEATFLMDGVNVFQEILNGIRWVAAGAPHANSYIRLAYWAVDLNTDLGGGNLLQAELVAAANAGHRVQIILWNPGQFAQLAGFGPHAQNHRQIKATLEGGNPYANGGRIDVFLETQASWIPGQSIHQKIAIFARNGLPRRAIVGGLNLDDWYIDTVLHPGGNGGPRGYIHDTAVRLRGPAAAGVDSIWLGRWNRGHWWPSQLAANPAVEPGYPPVAAAGGAPLPVQVTLAETDNSGWFRKTDIQALLLQAIAGANNYVYLENYAVTDPAIVAALARRKQAVPGLQIILLVPQPLTAQPGGTPMTPYDYLQFFTYVKLAFDNCTSLTFQNPPPAAPTVVARAGRNPWQIRESWNFWSTLRGITNTVYNGWMQYDTVVYDDPVTGLIRSRRILDITAITNPGVRMYSPGRATAANAWVPIYVHSKLALIDDEIAVIGSANFTYRSMIYDGELSAFIHNPGVVTNIRNTLFGHYNMPGPAAWDAQATVNDLARTAGMMPLGVLVMPLDVADFSRAVPTSFANATFY